AKSLAFAAFLQQVWGLKKGERFGLMLPNVLAYPIALLGALRAGLIVVNINPLYTQRELVDELENAGCHHLIVLDLFAHTVAESWQEAHLTKVIVAQLGDFCAPWKASLTQFILKYVARKIPAWHLPNYVSLSHVLETGKNNTLDKVHMDKHDVAFLQYTGGTTGVAKGAELTHFNLLSNLLQAKAWIQPVLDAHNFKRQLTIVTAIPLYHIFSLLANGLLFMYLGGKNLLILNPKDFKGFVKRLKKEEFHAITGVNTLYNFLLNTPGFEKVNFSSLLFCLGGGTAIQEEVAKRWVAKTGVPLLAAYGLTETSPAVSITPLTAKAYNTSVGLPISSTEVSIRDGQGEELPLGASGELCVRGPQVMRGYWRNESETRLVFWPEGWLRTGDIARIDEKGQVYILERSKDMILVSGFNVYPTEIEGVLAMHPGILESGVIGIPSDTSGEEVKAFIVKKDPNLTVESVIEHCKKNLTGYKLPHVIEFCDALPKTAVGKILRKELRVIASN
ncbi:MAG: AMP-dependent synthetase and ligase, partial [Gammaproteobacteria bacterium]|nr:AMP-dependent synthetase and ligase [Gammaproteobacteria bacterium]